MLGVALVTEQPAPDRGICIWGKEVTQPAWEFSVLLTCMFNKPESLLIAGIPSLDRKSALFDFEDGFQRLYTYVKGGECNGVQKESTRKF